MGFNNAILFSLHCIKGNKFGILNGKSFRTANDKEHKTNLRFSFAVWFLNHKTKNVPFGTSSIKR
jgi:hypothetical protein